MDRLLLSLAAFVALLPSPSAQTRIPPEAEPRPPPTAAERPPAAAPPAASPGKAIPRGSVLEEVSGTVRDIDRKEHRLTVDTGAAGTIALSLDRNTMVYTAKGLGTVLDIAVGSQIRAGRNADLLAYWVQVREVPAPGGTAPPGGSPPPAGPPPGEPSGAAAAPATAPAPPAPQAPPPQGAGAK